MQRVNEFNFYELACNIHPLTKLESPLKFSTVWVDLWRARHEANVIFNMRPLSVCAQAATNLHTAITAIVPEKWEDLSIPDAATEEPIPAWRISQVQQAAKTFETILAAECQVLDTYFVSKKGAYSTADLVDHAHHHIPAGTRGNLPDQTKNDFDQAGKCLAFDLPTAAAFHLLRGTEAVLREYYALIVPGPKQAPTKMRNWGVYIRLLKENGADGR